MRPTPEPDPEQLSLESLERQLRALPPSEVPEGLSSKLVAAIPPIKTGSAATATGAKKLWTWMTGVGLICVTTGALFVARHLLWNTAPSAQPNDRPSGTSSSTTQKEAPATSKVIQQYERTISVDPYNADAWFNLAKAQAEARRANDAIASAQKALDVARSRNRSDLAATIEAWLRSYRAAESRPSAR